MLSETPLNVVCRFAKPEPGGLIGEHYAEGNRPFVPPILGYVVSDTNDIRLQRGLQFQFVGKRRPA